MRIFLILMLLAGRRYVPAGSHVPVVSYGVALLLSTWSTLSVGFVIASLVPTARFAQPITALVLYPMIALSGLFFPIEILPGPLALAARMLPLTYAVSLLDGVWRGEPWLTHLGDVTALIVIFVVFTSISSRMFRWE